MHNNLKKIIVIVGIIFISIIAIFIMFVKSSNQKNNIKPLTKEELYQDYDEKLQESYFEVEDYYIKDAQQYGDNRAIACILFNDERDKWKFIPLSDDFLKKYKNRKVLEDNNIKRISYNDAIDEMFSGLDDKDYGRRIKCEKTDGIYALLYELDLDNYNRINDIKVLKEIKLFDYLTGYTKDYYIKFNEENYWYLFEYILFPSYTKTIVWPTVEEIDRHNVALTQNFINKYGYDEDIIKYDTPLTLNSIIINEKKSSFNDRIISFDINLKYENRSIYYKYKFILDKDNFLDDLELIDSEEFHNSNLQSYNNEWDIFKTVIVKNSSWERCPLSENFLKKYNNNDSIFPGYDVKDLIYSNKYKIFKDNKKISMISILLSDGTELPVLFKFKYDVTNKVDDILTYIVPEDKMNLTYEEMYQLAFND